MGDPVKLISPVFDVTALVYAQIAFYVTKDSWDGDQNFLNLYYRTSPESEWHLFYTDVNTYSDWVRIELTIPEKSATLQLAFEGVPNFGYPIGLDSVFLFNSDIPLCQPVVVTPEQPFFESFEGEDFGCWELDGNFYWTIDTEVPQGTIPGGGTVSTLSKHGSRVALYAEGAVGTHGILRSPLLNVSALENPTLSFWVVKSAAGDNVNKLVVSYRDSELGEWTVLTEDEEIYDNWTRLQFTLPNEGLEMLQLSFEAYGQSGYPIGLDSLFVYGIAAPDTTAPVDPIEPVNIAEANMRTVAIYPNPVHDVLNVQSADFQQLEIVNFVGQTIYRTPCTGSTMQVNVSEFSAGVYFVRLHRASEVVTQKVVVY